MKQVRQYFGAMVVLIGLIALDLWTKSKAVQVLKDGPIVLIDGVFELRYLENEGAAFGILQNQQWFFYLITLVFLIGITYFFVRMPMTRRFLPLRVVSVVLTAGAVGNLYDRITLRYVRDFLYVSLIDFPIFNVADIYVTCSAAVLFLLILFYYKDEEFDFLKRNTV